MATVAKKALELSAQGKELLLQALEHERGGVLIYQTALECAVNPGLTKEWEKYLAQTENHVQVLTLLLSALDLDPDEMTPGRQIVRHTGKSLLVSMKMALGAADSVAAELVACDCVVLAETKDHFNWELIGKLAGSLQGETAALLQEACAQVEDEEDEHLYHTRGWCRELWFKALGLDAELPPPEEKRDVRTAKDAADAEEKRK